MRRLLCNTASHARVPPLRYICSTAMNMGPSRKGATTRAVSKAPATKSERHLPVRKVGASARKKQRKQLCHIDQSESTGSTASTLPTPSQEAPSAGSLSANSEPLGNALVNLSQLVGIFRCGLRQPMSVDDIFSLDQRTTAISDFRPPRSLSTTATDVNEGPLARASLFRPSQLGSLLMKIEVPPVEVKCKTKTEVRDANGRVTAPIPREVLRRVLREELGLSVSSRTVNMNCVLMKDTEPSQYGVAELAALTRRPGVELSNAAKDGVDANSQLTPSALDATKAEESLRSRLQGSMASGDASIVLEETDHSVTVADEEQMMVDAVEAAVAGELQSHGEIPEDSDVDDDTVTHVDDGDADHLRSLLQHADTVEKDARDEMLARLKCGATVEASSDAEVFLPYKNGTVVPITTSYITRCERLSATFYPFAIMNNASEGASLSGLLRGVGQDETTVVTRVHHNDKEILAKAADQFHKAKELEDNKKRTLRSAGAVSKVLASGEKPAAQAIVLDAHLRNPKKIDIYFFSGDNYDILQEVM